MMSDKSNPVLTSNKLVVTIGMLLLLGLFGAGGAWLYYAELSGAIIAQGLVTIQGKPKSVQHLDGGIVSELNVEDGDVVKPGQLLMRLNDTQLTTSLEIGKIKIRELTARIARLKAERDDLATIKWRDDLLSKLQIEIDNGVKTGQQKLFEVRLETRLGQVAQLKEKIAQSHSQIEGISGMSNSISTQMTMVAKELSIITGLKKKGFATNLQMINLQREKESLSGQNAQLVAEEAQAKNAISEIKIQILQVDREFRQLLLKELREAEEEISNIVQQVLATQDKLQRIEIQAPVGGIIHQLSVFTIGGVIGPGATIMQIIPQDKGFEVEARVEPQFVDQLYPGQPANLTFSAFNQKTTPQILSQVSRISPDVIIDPQTGMQYYKLRLRVTKDELAKLGDNRLLAGMPVEVFVQTKKRTALNYILKPLTDQIRRAFKEE